ncbi:MAG: hypothetical protein Q7T82_09415 [Armatimonadota bacterium]|nr:hypothetical protein [Armatimonadota bacterium]
MPEPRLRTVEKVRPPFPLGQFPPGTVLNVAARIVYQLHTRCEARLEGSDWERIFAESVGANWTPSNIGLDDVRLDNCCWGAKTVKAGKPSLIGRIRLISGRNSLDYSYNQSDSRGLSPTEIGTMVLGIYNERVSAVRQRFKHCRTVVLVKSQDLGECAMFEFETLRYEPERYSWEWNPRSNLEGYDEEGHHKFTWQPHGSQFTIVQQVPPDRVAFQVRLPPPMSFDFTMDALGFDESWVTVLP